MCCSLDSHDPSHKQAIRLRRPRKGTAEVSSKIPRINEAIRDHRTQVNSSRRNREDPKQTLNRHYNRSGRGAGQEAGKQPPSDTTRNEFTVRRQFGTLTP